MPHHKRLESMLFDYETTGRTDFRHGGILPVVTTKYGKKPMCVGMRPPPLKYIHTLTEWQTPTVPIDLYLKPKEIVRTNPRDIQKEYRNLPDLAKEQVRKTRPRLVMTPAISLDDIEDDEVRNRLLNDVYDTTANRAMRDGIPSNPLEGLTFTRSQDLAPPNPIPIPKLQVPYVSPEWRMDSASWDGRQLRTFANPTEDFWLARKPRSSFY